MGKETKIEWCDHTFNPWIGCTKVSPGCANCYADQQDKFRKWTPEGWGAGKPRRRTSPANWKEPLKWEGLARLAKDFYMAGMADDKLRPDIKPYHRPRVFCASLSDWLDDEVPAEWLFDLITMIHKTPSLDWLLLTKRPENWESRLKAAAAQCTIDPLDITDRIYAWLEGERIWHNVWIGTTVEDQARADERIPHLLCIPARVRFLSCEPLLGPVCLESCAHSVVDGDVDNPSIVNAFTGMAHHPHTCIMPPETKGRPEGIHWVICGGESGPNARPMHPDWARGLRDQCQAAEVPFLFKQWGEWLPFGMGAAYMDSFKEARTLANGPGATGCPVYHVGKKAAGRLLDDREWNEFPKVNL